MNTLLLRLRELGTSQSMRDDMILLLVSPLHVWQCVVAPLLRGADAVLK